MLDPEITTVNASFEICAEKLKLEDTVKYVDWKKPVKRAIKRSRDSAGKLIELHPTKGWRRVVNER